MSEAAVRPNAGASSARAPGVSARLMRAYVGPNADGYLAKWRGMIKSAGSVDKAVGKFSWNWAGFFLSFSWLFYRKMYGMGVLFAALPYASLLIAEITGRSTAFLGLAMSTPIAAYGNGLYLRHAAARTRRLQAEIPDPVMAEAMAIDQGGTSWPAAITACIVYVVLFFGTILAFDGMGVGVNAKSDKLAEIGGVWRDPSGELIGFDLTAKPPVIKSRGRTVPVTVSEVDTTNDIVSLIIPTPQGGTGIWSIRKVWDSSGRFTLRLVIQTGAALDLDYVRALTKQD